MSFKLVAKVSMLKTQQRKDHTCVIAMSPVHFSMMTPTSKPYYAQNKQPAKAVPDYQSGNMNSCLLTWQDNKSAAASTTHNVLPRSYRNIHAAGVAARTESKTDHGVFHLEADQKKKKKSGLQQKTSNVMYCTLWELSHKEQVRIKTDVNATG